MLTATRAIAPQLSDTRLHYIVSLEGTARYAVRHVIEESSRLGKTRKGPDAALLYGLNL